MQQTDGTIQVYHVYRVKMGPRGCIDLNAKTTRLVGQVVSIERPSEALYARLEADAAIADAPPVHGPPD